MGIVLTRIDDRLIHGQILETWVPFLNVDCIVVANDQIAGNLMRRKLIHASVPKNIEVLFGSINELYKIICADEMRGRRILLLFSSSLDALKAFELGVSFSEINLGNLHGGPGGARVTCSVFLQQEDIENLTCLENSGVKISTQCVPTDRLKRWSELLGRQAK
ncbi:MAG: PTS sugar transporter subunit IIB [Deltaproteobacteria bacterium]|nr:PTS sugar transporter subunit IIB [Deltaproteobacteria bacterium]